VTERIDEITGVNIINSVGQAAILRFDLLIRTEDKSIGKSVYYPLNIECEAKRIDQARVVGSPRDGIIILEFEIITIDEGHRLIYRAVDLGEYIRKKEEGGKEKWEGN
jgi:hypothetical protein